MTDVWYVVVAVTGEAKIVDYPEVKAVAEKLNATPAQVLIAWGAYRGYSVIPKSVNKGHHPSCSFTIGTRPAN